MDPGWYPDPFGNGLRWWDGRTWTAHTSPTVPGFYQLDPRKDLGDEQTAARRASIAVIIAAVLGAVSELVAAFAFGDYFRSLVDAARTVGGTVNQPPMPAGVAVSELIATAAFVAQVFLMIWLYRAARFARNAGLPARRDPVWAALGFFIPIVNFWFPYQVAADSFPYTHPDRRLAGRWWTWYLISTLFVFAVLIASAFSTTASVVTALVGAGTYVLSAIYARRLIAAIGATHEQLLASFGGR
jgi:hypothetical protein